MKVEFYRIALFYSYAVPRLFGVLAGNITLTVLRPRNMYIACPLNALIVLCKPNTDINRIRAIIYSVRFTRTLH